MKRFYVSLLTFFFVIAVLFTSSGRVEANALPGSLVAAGITWVSGDETYTSNTISVVNLPGTTTIKSGMIVPVGFTNNGEKQFEGEGYQISSFDSGKLIACFPFRAFNRGWNGKVAEWTGTQWKLMRTLVISPVETGYSLACTTITHNGVYALLKWIG